MSDPIFVGSPVDVSHGEDARRRLATTNDTAFETKDGVLAVSEARWQQALTYERATWMDYNPQTSSDRNEFHAEQFGDYVALPGDLGNVVELGCGPFTNLRLILKDRTANSVTLVDPLIKSYIHHPNCAYANEMLAGQDVTLVESAVEDWKTRKKFDTVVMVNVIPHCRDANAVLDTVRKLLKKGGLLVIAEHPREHPAADHYDVGHPLALKAHVIEAFYGEFEEVYRNEWYFVGRSA